MFHGAKYDAKSLVWKPDAVPERLKKFVDFKPPPPPPPTPKGTYEDYWNKVIRLLWLSPSKERIRTVIKRVEPQVRSMRPALLQRIVRALHAATLTALMADKRQSILSFPLPHFSRWDFSDDGSNDDRFEDDESSGSVSSDDGLVDGRLNADESNNDATDNDGSNNDGSNNGDQLARERLDLYGELSAFLQNLLAKFYEITNSDDQHLRSPTTIPELVKSLNEQDGVPANFQSALRLFITTTWRSDPSVFDTDPSVAQVLVTSVKDFIAETTPDTSDRSKGIAIRLHTIAYGPHAPSKSIADLYGDPVKDDSECLSKFIHVTAAVLEAVFVKENPPGVSGLRPHVDRRTALTTVSPSFFTDGIAFKYTLDNPDHRLPYVYSLAIALSHGMEGIVRRSSEVLHLLRAPDERPRNAATKKTTNANEGTLDTSAAIEGTLDTNAVTEETPDTIAATERTLDTNTLVMNVAKQTLSRRRAEAVITEAEVQTYLGPITQALHPLQVIIENREAYPWRTRWKAIYLLVDIISVLPRSLISPRELLPRPLTELQSLINGTSEAARSYLDENAPARHRLLKRHEAAPRKWRTEPAPCDWRVKKDVLKICGLEEEVNKLAGRKVSTQGVYSWRELGKTPYLSLYPQRTRYDPTSRPYWVLEKLQR